jgi:hypothetical protein
MMNVLTLLSFVYGRRCFLCRARRWWTVYGFCFEFACVLVLGRKWRMCNSYSSSSHNKRRSKKKKKKNHSVKYTPTLTLYTITHHHSRRGYAAEKHSVYLERYCLTNTKNSPVCCLPQILISVWWCLTLRQFARNTGLGYTKRVECRATALGNDEERMDVGFAQLGFAAFDG